MNEKYLHTVMIDPKAIKLHWPNSALLTFESVSWTFLSMSSSCLQYRCVMTQWCIEQSSIHFSWCPNVSPSSVTSSLTKYFPIIVFSGERCWHHQRHSEKPWLSKRLRHTVCWVDKKWALMMLTLLLKWPPVGLLFAALWWNPMPPFIHTCARQIFKLGLHKQCCTG